MLIHFPNPDITAGCDEVGRGALSGPVVAAAVIVSANFSVPNIRDSKKLSFSLREKLSRIIKNQSLAWSIGVVSPEIIEKINILQASILAMHRALKKLKKPFSSIWVDGKHFNQYKKVPHSTIIGGDNKYIAIASASIIAKTYRDDLMIKGAKQFPEYSWEKNKGYGTKTHIASIKQQGACHWHRKKFLRKIIPTSPAI